MRNPDAFSIESCETREEAIAYARERFLHDVNASFDRVQTYLPTCIAIGLPGLLLLIAVAADEPGSIIATGLALSSATSLTLAIVVIRFFEKHRRIAQFAALIASGAAAQAGPSLGSTSISTAPEFPGYLTRYRSAFDTISAAVTDALHAHAGVHVHSNFIRGTHSGRDRHTLT